MDRNQIHLKWKIVGVKQKTWNTWILKSLQFTYFTYCIKDCNIDNLLTTISLYYDQITFLLEILLKSYAFWELFYYRSAYLFYYFDVIYKDIIFFNGF